MILFDPISESGHKEFNQLIFKNLNVKKDFLKIKQTNYILFHTRSLKNHYKLLKKSCSEDIFMVFNNFSMFVLTFFFRNINCSFIVHNNLDFGCKNFIHKVFYKRICKKLKLIFLENRLENLSNTLFIHRDSKSMNHPIINIINKNLEKSNTIFVSGRNLSRNQLIKVCQLESDNIVYCNSKYPIVEANNLISGHIDDFDDFLNKCSKIYLIGDYTYRVSGILYKVLSLDNVKIVFSNEIYFNEIVNKNIKCELLLNKNLVK
jgi:hypothetical protein